MVADIYLKKKNPIELHQCMTCTNIHAIMVNDWHIKTGTYTKTADRSAEPLKDITVHWEVCTAFWFLI